MKIRILIDAKQLGGVEIHAMNLCQELCRLNQDCKIILMRFYPDSILHQLFATKKINYCSCKTYAQLIRLLNKDQADIIHAHGYKANIFSRIYGLLSKTPIVTTFHSGERPIGRLILYNFIDRISSFLSTNICVTANIAQNLPSNSIIIPNFVEIPAMEHHQNTKPPFHIYFIGRISPEKGPLRFCQLAKENKNYIWHMVGTGPLLEKCKNECNNNIVFHGAVTDMEQIWPKVDLLCITSTYEGQPLVLLEAMSLGIPVLSFDVGNIKEVVTESEFVIENFDLQSMQTCIDAYFQKSIKERKLLAQRAKTKIISEFSKEVIVTLLLDIYKKKCPKRI